MKPDSISRTLYIPNGFTVGRVLRVGENAMRGRNILFGFVCMVFKLGEKAGEFA